MPLPKSFAKLQELGYACSIVRPSPIHSFWSAGVIINGSIHGEVGDSVADLVVAVPRLLSALAVALEALEGIADETCEAALARINQLGDDQA